MGLVQVAHAYDIDLNAVSKASAKVRIGGNAASTGDKFVPNINMSKWDDEHWINLNFPIAITNQLETFDGEKVSITVGDYSFVYYPKSLDSLEYEIVFGKKPPINTIQLDISSSSNLKFIKQPVLTSQEVDWGFIRPEDVVDSYAVFCEKTNNKYETGKFCHIYYPYLVDADGNRTRVNSFDISNGKFTIVLPNAWMNTARYPVVLDPSIGYSTAGASNFGSNILMMGPHSSTDATGGNTTTYHIAIAAVGADTNVKVAIYPGPDPNNDPRVEQTGAWSVAAIDDNQKAAGGAALAAATNYIVVSIPASSDTKIKYDTGSDGDGYYYNGTTYAAEFTDPANAGGWSTTAWKASQWVEYGGGAVSKKVQASSSTSRRRKMNRRNSGLIIV